MPKLNDTDTRGTTTAPRPTAKPNQADPTVTAGEVQGRGPYPGIPGYATSDDWNRVQTTGMYSAPDYVVQLLEKAGYLQASPQAVERPSFPGLDMKAAEELTPYDYRVSDDEARKILDTYAPDAKGDPAKITEQRVEGARQVVPLTVAAYNKLTPEQKAAVDFSTALVEAREKDLMGGWMIRVAPEEEAGKRKSMFGDDAPTGGYPEHTMKLLEKIGYKAPGTNLSDFLSLDMAITADELKDLKLPKGIDFSTTGTESEWAAEAGRHQGIVKDSIKQQNDAGYGKVRSAENLAMIELDVIRRASEVLAQARNSNTARSWSPAATATNWLGSGMRGERIPFGWGTSEDRSKFTTDAKERTKDGNFRFIFDVLMKDPSKTKVAESDAFWARLKETGYDEKDIDQLFEYLDQRTRAMIANGEKVAKGQNDAAIIRELAGLEPVNGSS